MRRFLLLAGIGSLAFGVACGGGNGSGKGSGGGGGSFSNASLSGQYAYQLSGLDVVGSFREAGVFAANGSGTITGGEDDFVQNTSLASATSSGTYTISSNGTGSITLNMSNGRSLLIAVTLVSTSKIYLVVGQEQVGSSLVAITGAGISLKQDSSAFTAPPSGTFVFRKHLLNVVQGTSSSEVGTFTIANGTANGSEDVNRAGVQSSLALSGSFNFPDTSGHGSGTFTDNAGTSTFLYYVVDSNRFFLLSTDTGILGNGQAEKQSATAFSAASLSGSYAFGSQGDTTLNFAGLNTVGRFTADGAGSISSGAMDSVQDGTSSSNISFTGTYTVNAAGKAVVTLNPAGGGTTSQIFWMVSPSRAVFLTDSASKIEDGTMDLQQGSSFSNATLSGQYAFVMDGFDISQNTFDRVGTINWGGSGNLTLDELINFNGQTSTPGSLAGTYTVAANGRGVASVSTLSNNVVFYLISANDAYMLQNDTGAEIQGTMSKQ